MADCGAEPIIKSGQIEYKDDTQYQRIRELEAENRYLQGRRGELNLREVQVEKMTGEIAKLKKDSKSLCEENAHLVAMLNRERRRHRDEVRKLKKQLPHLTASVNTSQFRRKSVNDKMPTWML